MDEDWRRLRVGNHIRMTAWPSEFSQPGYRLHEETAEVYRRVIAEGMVLEVKEIDDFGSPWFHFVLRGDPDEYHSLAIDHDGWEHVE